jgi:hypothetical protein
MSEGKKFIGILLGISLAIIGVMLILTKIFCLTTFDQWMQIVPTVFTAVGLCGAAYGWLHTSALKRTEFVMQFDDKLRFDPDISYAMYIVDYDDEKEKFWYNCDFHKSDEERKFDKLFSCLAIICHLKKHKLISEIEFGIFEYRINSVCVSLQVQSYFWNLRHDKTNNKPSSFQPLIDFMYEALDEAGKKRFDSPDSDISGYKKCLKF